jgi:hypothetical protein
VAISSCKKEDTPAPATPIDTFPAEFQALRGIFNGEGIGAAVNLSEDVILLFNLDGSRYAWFEENEIKAEYQLSDNDGHFDGLAFNDIGAAVLMYEYRIYFFDEDGERYTSADFDPENVEGGWNNSNLFSFNSGFSEVESWGPDNTIPYFEVGAMWNFSDPGTDCFDAEENYDGMWIVNGAGTKMIYWQPLTFVWGDEYDTEDWTAENNCGGPDGLMPYDRIGAACRYVKPNLIQELFFNEDGTKFWYYTVSEGVFSEVLSLY